MVNVPCYSMGSAPRSKLIDTNQLNYSEGSQDNS